MSRVAYLQKLQAATGRAQALGMQVMTSGELLGLLRPLIYTIALRRCNELLLETPCWLCMFMHTSTLRRCGGSCPTAKSAVHGVQKCGVGAGKVLGDWQLCGVKSAGAGATVLMLRWAGMAPHVAGLALGRWQGRGAGLP